MIARLVGVAAGVWLMASPAVLGYVDTTAATSDRIVGPVAAALSFVAIWGITRALRWCTLPLGAWSAAGPWLLGFPTEAAISGLGAGVAFIATAFVRGEVRERYGGGWMSLRPGRRSDGRSAASGEANARRAAGAGDPSGRGTGRL